MAATETILDLPAYPRDARRVPAVRVEAGFQLQHRGTWRHVLAAVLAEDADDQVYEDDRIVFVLAPRRQGAAPEWVVYRRGRAVWASAPTPTDRAAEILLCEAAGPADAWRLLDASGTAVIASPAP